MSDIGEESVAGQLQFTLGFQHFHTCARRIEEHDDDASEEECTQNGRQNDDPVETVLILVFLTQLVVVK